MGLSPDRCIDELLHHIVVKDRIQVQYFRMLAYLMQGVKLPIQYTYKVRLALCLKRSNAFSEHRCVEQGAKPRSLVG
jgi:hypothetical protein